MKRRRNTRHKLRKNGEYGIAFAALIPLIGAVVGGGASIFAGRQARKAAEASAAAQQQQAMVDAQIAAQRTRTALTVAGIVAGTAIVGVVLWKMLGSDDAPEKHEKKKAA
jgi:hypothetical protein